MSSSTATGQFQVRLSPLHQGAFTQVVVVGSVPTAIPRHLLRQLTRRVSFWSGWPVALVLPAEGSTVAWLECWAAALSGIPAGHLQLRYEIMTEAPRDE